jgi:hypothetical protein
MIAILHADGKIGLLLNEALSIDGENITTQTGEAKGVKHDIIVVSDYTYGEEIVPATYMDVVHRELDLSGMPKDIIDKVLVTPEMVKPFIKKGNKRYDIGDTINPANFTDTRGQLALTPEQQKDQLINQLQTTNTLLEQRLQATESAVLMIMDFI